MGLYQQHLVSRTAPRVLDNLESLASANTDSLQEEWSINRKKFEKQEKEQLSAAKKHKTLLATERKRQQRAKQVAKDIKTGRHDSNRNIVEASKVCQSSDSRILVS